MSTVGVVKAAEYIGARELRARLAQVMKSRRPFVVTDHGKPVKAMVPYLAFLELLDAIEELKDEALRQEIGRSRAEYASGSWRPLASLQRLLGGRG